MEKLGTLLSALAVFVFVFYWFGGFDLIRFFKARQLKKQIKNPSAIAEVQESIAALKSGHLVSLTALEVQLVAEEIIGDESWVERLYDKHADSIDARYLYGVFLIKKGWLARGGGSASSVRAEDSDLFINALQRAEFVLTPLLENAGQLTPAVVYQLLLIYKGISKAYEAEDLYAHYGPLYKTNLLLHITKLGQMASRWGGDSDKMFDTAKALSRQGQLMPSVLAAAWIEHAIDEDKKRMKKGLEQSGDLSLILNAFQSLKPLPAGAGMNNVEDYQLVLASNIYAAYFHLLDDKENAKEALSRTAGYYTSYPWKYLHTNPQDAYNNALVTAKVRSFQ